MYAELCRALPEGQADADAFLAGRVMPSVAQKKARRGADLVAFGAEVIHAGR